MTPGSSQDVGHVVVHCTVSRNTRPFHQPLKSTYTQWLRPHPEWRVSQVSHRLLKSGLCIDRGWSSILIARIIEWYLYFIFAESVASSYCERGDSRDQAHPRIGVLLCDCCDCCDCCIVTCDLRAAPGHRICHPSLQSSSSHKIQSGADTVPGWTHTQGPTSSEQAHLPPFHHFLSSPLSARVSRWINYWFLRAALN